MNVFLSGGCKNGKSHYGQRLAKDMAEDQGVPLYYLATMIPSDEEDRERIEKHIKDREGWGFVTIEQERDICKGIRPGKGVYLLDSVTALLSNEMFPPSGEVDKNAGRRVARQLTEFAYRTGNTVFVSDFIYCDALKYDEITECYRKNLAFVDKKLAQQCERVIEVAFSNKKEYK